MILTAAATVVTWLGVGAVTRAVTASAEPAIPHVTLAAQSPSTPAQSTAPTTTAPTTAPTTTTTLPLALAPPTFLPTSRASGASTTAPTTTTVPVVGSTSTSTQPVGPGTTQTPASTPATYSSPGGQATVRCTGDEISLVSAAPANGYQVKVDNDGPKMVTVSFSGSGGEYQISAACQNGSPVQVEGGSDGSPTD
jgi:hypothetical protein